MWPLGFLSVALISGDGLCVKSWGAAPCVVSKAQLKSARNGFAGLGCFSERSKKVRTRSWGPER